MTQSLQNCPECGNPLPTGAPDAPCPVCLMKLGLDSWTSRERVADDPANTPTQLTPGSFTAPQIEEIQPHFPQFEILELLGKGGMGAVYKARQKTLDRHVALKIINPTAAADPNFAERFAREARSLAKLSHQNIITVHDFGKVEPTEDNEQSGTLFFIVMEYVDGLNLRQLVREGELAPAETLKIVPAICDALQYAHDQGIVHRDIKPENILVDTSGRVKIADFGLAKLVGQGPKDVTLTGAYQAMGTLHYMAPEQMERPLEVDHRADIYALGVTLYELLTGELPIGRFAPPSKKVQVDVRLDEIVLRTLEREPERRYQNASDMKTAMETLSTVPAKKVAAYSGDDSEEPSKEEIAIGRDIFLFLISAGGMYAYAQSEPALQIWYPIFPIAALLLTSLLNMTRFMTSKSAKILLVGSLIISLVMVFSTGLISKFLAVQLMGESTAKPADDIFVLLSTGIFSAWILLELLITRFDDRPSLLLRFLNIDREQLAARFADSWNGLPKFVRTTIHWIIGLSYLFCLYMFFSTHGARTPDLHQFDIGNPHPWFKLEVTENGFSWNLIFGSAALVGLFAWALIKFDRYLIDVENAKQDSIHWHTLIWGFLLAGVNSLGVHSLILHQQSGPAEKMNQVPPGIAVTSGMLIMGIVLMFVGINNIRRDSAAMKKSSADLN